MNSGDTSAPQPHFSTRDSGVRKIHKCIRVKVLLTTSTYPKEGVETEALVDSGANLTVIPEKWMRKNNLPFKEIGSWTVKVADRIKKEVKKVAMMKMTFAGVTKTFPVIIADVLEPCLGMDFLTIFNLSLLAREFCVQFLDTRKKVYGLDRRVFSHLQHETWDDGPEDGISLIINSFESFRQEVEKFYERAEPEVWLCTFYAGETTTLPKNSRKCVHIISDKKGEDGTVIFNASNELTLDRLCIPFNSLLSTDSEFMYFHNFGNEDVEIKAGTELGVGTKPHEIYHFTILGKISDGKARFSPGNTEKFGENLSEEEKSLHHHVLNYEATVVNDSFDSGLIDIYPEYFSSKDSTCRNMMDRNNERSVTFGESSDKGKSQEEPKKEYVRPEFDPSNFNIGELPDEQKKRVLAMLKEYHENFAYNIKEIGAMDRSKIPEQKIETGDHPATRMPPHRTSQADLKIIRDQVKDMLDAGIIEESDSEWACPVVVVTKKDGSPRFCVNYRRPNELCFKMDAYPMPRVEDAMDSLTGAVWFSTLDLFSGYHQLPLTKESREKTAFVTGFGLYQYKVLPFGLHCAPAKFQRAINRIFSRLNWKTVFIYLDDIIVFAKDFEEHCSRLREVMETIKFHNLKLHPKKCFFFQKEVEYLGHILSKDGIQPMPSKVEKVMKFPTPETRKQLRGFLGLANYYRSFIKGFSLIAQPLYKSLKGDDKLPFSWEEEQTKAFNTLKEALCKEPILTYYRPDAKKMVSTDACGEGVAGILKQEEIDPKSGKSVWKVLQYWGRGLTPAESRYPPTELELLAIVNAVEQFRIYLLGGPQFLIVSDHQALQYTKSLLNNDNLISNRIKSWLMRLQGFDYRIVYKPGVTHCDADALSRAKMPIEESKLPFEEAVWDTFEEILEENQREKITKELPLDIMKYQDEDSYCSRIRELIRLKKDKKLRKKFLMADGILFRLASNMNEVRPRCVVPDKLKNDIMHAFHGATGGGHPGINGSFLKAKEKYWWPLMKADITKFVRSCDFCQRKKAKAEGEPELKPLVFEIPEIANGPFTVIGLDGIVLKDHSSNRDKYILNVIDYNTRFMVAAATRNFKAATVIKFMDDRIIHTFGAPRIIITDRGPQLMSKDFRTWIASRNIDHRKTSCYKPSTNGCVERANRTLKLMMAGYVNQGHDNWSKCLAMALFAYNTTVHESTGFSPFSLLFNFTPRMVIDNLTGVPTVVTENQTEWQESKISEDLRKKRRLALESLERSGKRMLIGRKNAGKHVPKFSPGEKVLLWTHEWPAGIVKGFFKPWRGPYTVIREVGPNSYELVLDSDHSVIRGPEAAQAMKRYHKRDDAFLQLEFDWSKVDGDHRELKAKGRQLDPDTGEPLPATGDETDYDLFELHKDDAIEAEIWTDGPTKPIKNPAPDAVEIPKTDSAPQTDQSTAKIRRKRRVKGSEPDHPMTRRSATKTKPTS